MKLHCVCGLLLLMGGGIVATETAWAHASSQDDMQKWQTVCDQYVAGVHVSILVCCMPRGRG